MGQGEQWQVSPEAAELYERYPARYILGPWAPLLADAAHLAEGERVLDMACGTGLVTRIAAQRVGTAGLVVGIDLNPGMIAVARSLAAPTGGAIRWLEGSALDLQLLDAAFDVVLCQQGLQFFPNKLRALREMHRVLVPRGRLALSVWTGVGPYHGAVGDALSRYIGTGVAAKFCSSRQVPDKDELRRLAADAGFSDVEVRISQLDLHLPRLNEFVLDHLASTPVAPMLGVASPEVRNNIAATVAEQLRSYVQGEGISYPEEIHLVTARVK